MIKHNSKLRFDWASDFSEGLACVKVRDNLFSIKDRDKWGFINKDGKTVIDPQFDMAAIFLEGLARVEYGQEDRVKPGFIDKTGKMIIEPQFDYSDYSIGDFYDGMASVLVECEGYEFKYGFIDKTGKMVIKPQFSGGGTPHFSEGLACVGIGGKEGFIDKTGKVVF